jgi:hypothetical protein
MRWMRFLALGVSCLASAVTATVLAIAVNIATSSSSLPWWLTAVQSNPWPWVTCLTAVVCITAVLAWWSQRFFDARLAILVPAQERPEPWMVGRPIEVDQIVAALRRGGSMVGVSTALHGAGGFGKTTVAKMVRLDRRILRRYDRLVYWVTLGRDTRRGALADKINDLIRRIDPDRQVTFTDAQQAGRHLASLLQTGPRRLIILDDAWFPEQIEAFAFDTRSALLVTTRNHTLVGARSVQVKVVDTIHKRALPGLRDVCSSSVAHEIRHTPPNTAHKYHERGT